MCKRRQPSQATRSGLRDWIVRRKVSPKSQKAQSDPEACKPSVESPYVPSVPSVPSSRYTTPDSSTDYSSSEVNTSPGLSANSEDEIEESELRWDDLGESYGTEPKPTSIESWIQIQRSRPSTYSDNSATILSALRERMQINETGLDFCGGSTASWAAANGRVQVAPTEEDF